MERIVSILIIVCSLLLYLRIGTAIARQSWRAWFDDEERSWRSFLFFPVSHVADSLGDGAPVNFLALSSNAGWRIRYLACIALLWPIKVAWNLAVCLVVGVPWFLHAALKHLVAGRVHSFAQPQPKNAPADPKSEAPAPVVELRPLPSPELELAELLIERRRLNRRISELEIKLSTESGSGKYPRARRSDEN